MSTAAVDAWLDECRGRLPLQNPLWAFVHNNVLQAFETQRFEDAVQAAAALYRAHPYENEAFFRSELARGRIHRDALDAVLARSVPELRDAPDRVERFLADPSIGDDRAAWALLPGPAADHMVRYSVRDRPLADFLVPLIASYLDQGMAAWSNPFAHASFWELFQAAVRDVPSFSCEFQRELVAQLDRHTGSLEQLIAREVQEHAPAGEEARYCLQTLFVLKGWSGMVQRLEKSPELAPLEAPRITLEEWLAALLISIHALDAALRARDEDPPNPRPIAHGTIGLGRLERWQRAYEDSFDHELLGALHAPLPPSAPVPPSAQVLACMDDRMESFRRALECSPELETVGTLGSFGVNMRFHALDATQPTRQSPPVIEPRHDVYEVSTRGSLRVRRSKKVSASLALAGFYQSRTLVRGFVVSVLLGTLSFVPLVLNVLLPRATRRMMTRVRNLAFPRHESLLDLSPFDKDEQATIVEQGLRAAGIAERLAPLVAVVGHSATSSNNPFRQAYGCGACSGNGGSPNARAFAAIANDPDVRARLARRGCPIPEGTLFLPYAFDTTLSSVERLDRSVREANVQARIEALDDKLARAATADAEERSQRFVEGPLPGKLAAAHVVARGYDLAQPRPELGHSRVAACIVGRRELTRDRSLDRRVFLVSYDPTKDDGDGRWLREAVYGAVPVAVNIAMDYYFSRVDPDGFGCGSKLPLNVVSLLGVITGSKSDLRLGLARQMVELHEPMRPLILLEARAELALRVMLEHERLATLLRNGWMRLGRIDPETRALELYDGERFVPWTQGERADVDAANDVRPPVLRVECDRVAFQ